MTWTFDLVAGPFKGRTGGLAWDGSGMLCSVVLEERVIKFDPKTGSADNFRKYTGRTNGISVAADGSVFGAQEGGSDAEISAFCGTTYGVTFPLFSKVDVNGDQAHPLFKWLKSEKKGIFGTESIKWNFTKFLVGPDGHVIKRYGSGDTPEAIEKDLFPEAE